MEKDKEKEVELTAEDRERLDDYNEVMSAMASRMGLVYEEGTIQAPRNRDGTRPRITSRGVIMS